MHILSYLSKKATQSFLMGLVFLSCSLVSAQTSVNNYKTGSPSDEQKTFVLNNPGHVKIPAPPGKEQTLQELNEVKKKIAQRDQKSMQQVQYWDAGAPSYRWNEIAYKLISFENFPTFLRVPSAWMNMAVHDATLVAINGKKNYKRNRPSQTDLSIKPIVQPTVSGSYPCEHTATAAAAATVLAYFYPEKADSLLRLAKEAGESRIYAGVQYPSDVKAGWKLGEEIAAIVIEKAKKDGSDIPWKGTMRNDPKYWRGDYPVGITAASFTPIILTSGNQFRPPAPPDFAKEMEVLKNFKQDFNSTHLAYHWASLSGFDFWTEQASKKIFEYHLDNNALASSRIFTLLHVAMHDGAIAIMDAKYAYWGIRPFQLDSTYKPLIMTPPFPGYPSGHATASSTAATVLAHFFPADAASFHRAAQECADSRFYAGIHFKVDNETGLQLGKKLGQYVVEKWSSAAKTK